MSGEQPASGPTKRGTLRTRDVTGLPTHPVSEHARVINGCRGGHEEIVEVHTEIELIAGMTAGICRYVMPSGRACGALIVVSKHISPDGNELGMILIPDEPTEKAPGEPADEQ